MPVSGLARSGRCVEVRVRRDLARLAAQSLATSGDVTTATAGLGQWTKVTKTFTDFSVAALTKTITIYTAAAGTVILGVKMKHSVSFSGGGIATYTITVGDVIGGVASISGAPGFNVFQATGDSVGYQVIGNPAATVRSTIFNQTATTAVTATATASANLNLATQGSVDIWLFVSSAT